MGFINIMAAVQSLEADDLFRALVLYDSFRFQGEAAFIQNLGG